MVVSTCYPVASAASNFSRAGRFKDAQVKNKNAAEPPYIF
jgi:hypothetical protein